MKISELATLLHEIEDDIQELEMDMFSSAKELKDKENEKKKVLNELILFDKFEDLYKNNEKYELDSSLLYPFKSIIDEKGNEVFVCKDKEEYKEDVNKYLEDLNTAYEEGKIDKKTYNEMKEDAMSLAKTQLKKIKEEEKEQEEEKEEDIDLEEEYHKTLESIESTKKAFIVNQIGEESYNGVCIKYKNMQEIERKQLLRKTHLGLCKEMGITCDLSYTKYELKTDQTVSRDGYCIQEKDLNEVPYPLDTILLEQTFKLHIKQILNNKSIPLHQVDQLTKLLFKDLEKQKELVFQNAKKREISPYPY